MADEMKRASPLSKGGEWHHCRHDRPGVGMRRVAERTARRKLKRETARLAEAARQDRLVSGARARLGLAALQGQ